MVRGLLRGGPKKAVTRLTERLRGIYSLVCVRTELYAMKVLIYIRNMIHGNSLH